MIDRFGRNITYLRISVTDLCNLRCRYCMPEEGISKKTHNDMMTENEIITAVEAAVALGISKIRISGGEPLVKKNILSICRKIAAVDGVKELCLTTNGILLPRFAKSLKEAGVKRLNLSLDTLEPEKYAYITRIGNLGNFMEGLQAALEAGFVKVKINTVLIGGFNEDEICALAELTRQYPIDIRFIEMMPMYDSGDFHAQAFLPNSKVLEYLTDVIPSPHEGGVANLFHLPGAKGNIGLISPVNAPFCGNCNRIRLTSDGKLKPCLHTSDEYPLKGLDYASMKAVMENAIWNKPPWHGGLDADNRSRAERNMNEIGG